MNFQEYQKQAMSFRLPTATAVYALLNLSGEVGELHSLVAKAIRDGKKDDFHNLALKELGDVLWQLSAVASDLGFNMEQVAAANIAKLSKRKEDDKLQGSGDNR